MGLINVKKKQLTTGCGKFIDVYDDVFSFQEQEFFEIYFKNSFFKYSNSASSLVTAHLPNTFIYSKYNNDNVANLNFFNVKNVSQILSGYGNLEFSTAWVNLSLPGTYYQKHTDVGNEFGTEQISLMYYGTTTWQDSYGGETFFYNDFGEKEIVVDYIPGRVVVFDSLIPHKPAFSYGHTVGRYVFVSLLKRN